MLGSAFTRIFAPLLRFMQPERPNDCDSLFPPGGDAIIPILMWTKQILDLDIAIRSNVLSLKHYKSKEGLEHEFLLAEVRHPSGAISAFVIDRCADASSSQSNIMYSKPVEPHDRVIFKPGGAAALATMWPNCHLLRIVTWRNETPSVVELAVVLNAVREIGPEYRLHDQQCYWFASMVWTALMKLFPSDGLVEVNTRLLSTWRGYTIPIATNIELVVDRYKSNWEGFQDQVERKRLEVERKNDEVSSPDCYRFFLCFFFFWGSDIHYLRQRQEELKRARVEGRLEREEETRQREEETRQREDETRQREDETRQREDETRQREEETRQKEEEIRQREEETRQREEEIRRREEEVRRWEEERRRREEDLYRREQDLHQRERKVEAT
jgi:hypothetical protein